MPATSWPRLLLGLGIAFVLPAAYWMLALVATALAASALAFRHATGGPF